MRVRESFTRIKLAGYLVKCYFSSKKESTSGEFATGHTVRDALIPVRHIVLLCLYLQKLLS